MKSWFCAARKTQTLRSVQRPSSGPDPNLPSPGWAGQTPGSACSNLFSVANSRTLFLFLFFSIFFHSLIWVAKRKWFLKLHQGLPSGPDSWQCTCRDTEQWRGSCTTAWAFCSTSAILITHITLWQGDPAGRFQVTYKEKIIFILCSFFLNCTD